MINLMQTGDTLGSIIWFLMFFVFIFIYPRLMLSQMIYKIEQSARKLEQMSEHSNKMTAKKISKTPNKELKEKVDEFTDFFVVEPSNIDPYGLVDKIDRTIRNMESRFDDFVDEVAPGKNKQEKREINYGLRASMGLRQISKIVRHYVEMAKKFKNLQIAMIIQMQLPIIEKIAEGELKGTEAFVNGWPIGDSIGPLVAASYMNNGKEIAEDIVYDRVIINGRVCHVLKASGPEPSLGRIDEAMVKIMKRKKIAHIVTIDAAQKLEGEKTGTVSEGVGFAMGGIGQREIIENILLPQKKTIDSIVIKVGMVEAIMPMRKDVYDSLPKVRTKVEKSVGRAKKGQHVLVIGVGNSCGVGNSKKVVDEVKKVVDTLEKKYKLEESKKKKKGWI